MAQNTIKENLVSALKTISEDPDFLLSVINHVKNDQDRLALTDYVKSNPAPTYEDVLLLSIAIYDERSE